MGFLLISMVARIAFILAFAAVFLWKPADGNAQKLSFIRDAEIESSIRDFAAPLFQAAGLEPSAIKVFLIKDKGLNAFVAGGQKLFLNTGLLMRAENAGQIIGVIAHETGHIAGGHLSRIHRQLGKTSAQNILSYVLGAAAAIGTGSAEVGAAVISGGQHAARRTLLRYSRTQESSSDASAVRYLHATGQSARGLAEFLAILGDQELLSVRFQDPYVTTHPLTRDRIDALREMIARSEFRDAPTPKRLIEKFDRMQAKLYAFLEPVQALRRYKESDTRLIARYARAIAYYRRSDLKAALLLIDGLIRDFPGDPYFHEVKGQMLFENGRVEESLEPYEAAVKFLPASSLIRTSLARVQLELSETLGNSALLEPAVRNLRAALQVERASSFIWRQLATAYGRQGKMGLSSLALAEEALLRGKKKDARYFAGRAIKSLPKGSPYRIQANDILLAAKKKK